MEEEEEEDGVAELIIPRHFLWPISLDLMKDLVILCFRITYDRENIERWMESGNSTCPATNKTLTGLDPIPNHSIREMIQEWCEENRAHGIERILTPIIPVSSEELTGILNKVEAGRDVGDAEGCRQLVSRIKSLGKESESNKKRIAKSGAGRVLSATFQAFSAHFWEHIAVLDEILSVLAMITPLDGSASALSSSSLNAIFWFINYGDLSARSNAGLVLKELLSSENHKIVDEVVEIQRGLEGLVKLVKEPISPAMTKTTLITMYHIIPRFVAMGLVERIAETLADSEKSLCEKALGVLDEVCSFRQGKERAYGSALFVSIFDSYTSYCNFLCQSLTQSLTHIHYIAIFCVNHF